MLLGGAQADLTPLHQHQSSAGGGWRDALYEPLLQLREQLQGERFSCAPGHYILLSDIFLANYIYCVVAKEKQQQSKMNGNQIPTQPI